VKIELKIKKKPFFLFLTAVLAGMPSVANGSAFLRPCAETGNCGICDIVAQAVTLGKILITGSAGVALVVIVWASIGMINSAGNSDKISMAKKQITGAVIGVILVFVAFQIVSIVIFTLAVPSSMKRVDTNEKETEQLSKAGNLSNFLFKPWWTICDENELIEKQGRDTTTGTTANCIYWGDNTSCGKEMVCCQGVCQAATCEPPASVKKYIQTQYDTSESATEETRIRKLLEDGGVKIFKKPCVPPNTVNCVNVAGLHQSAIDGLIRAAGECGGTDCIIITGGTEPGHDSHGPGLAVVDIAYSLKATQALDSIGLRKDANFGTGYTCEKKDIGKVTCGPGADWIHVEF